MVDSSISLGSCWVWCSVLLFAFTSFGFVFGCLFYLLFTEGLVCFYVLLACFRCLLWACLMVGVLICGFALGFLFVCLFGGWL